MEYGQDKNQYGIYIMAGSDSQTV